MSSNPSAAVLPGAVLASSQYAPLTNRVTFATTSATLAALAVAGTTVAAASNGGVITNIAAWANPSAGVLTVAATAGFPVSGSLTVACTVNSPATIAYTGTTATTFTGCTYVSGGTGTVATGGAVALTGVSVNTGLFTAPPSGNVLVTVSFCCTGAAGVISAIALAAHGTVTPVLGNVATFESSAATNQLPLSIPITVTGLTANSTYTFDLLSATASSTLSITAAGSTSTTPTGQVGQPLTMTVSAL